MVSVWPCGIDWACWIPFDPDKCWQGENVNVIKGGCTVDVSAVRTKSTVDVADRSQHEIVVDFGKKEVLTC